jgi:hypothetical protein
MAADVLDLTLSLDTSIYADGDVLADRQELANAVRFAGGVAYLHSLFVLDEDDQGVDFDLIFLNADVTLGTENAAASITDANARTEIGRVSVVAADYYDQGGSKVACIKNIGLMLKAAPGVTSIYVGAISRGTGTYTVSGIRLKLGLMWE